MTPGYYYLHANSQIIWSSEYPSHEYVIKVWKVESQKDYQDMMIKAKNIDNGV